MKINVYIVKEKGVNMIVFSSVAVIRGGQITKLQMDLY